MGSASLLGSGGVVQYGTGRIFLQGPSEMDLELMLKRGDDDFEARRLEEEGQEGILAPGEWAQYAEPEEVRGVMSLSYRSVDRCGLSALQLDEFLAWLNPKGVRELALKNSFTKWWCHIAPGIRKRISVSTNDSKICFYLITLSRIST
jgi:hypothetical protein